MKFSGNRPDMPNVGVIGDWEIFARYSSSGWCSVKLVARKRMPHKANYWLGWKGGNLGGRDFHVLAEHRPELAAQLRAVLCELFRHV